MKPLHIPPIISAALAKGAALVISLSGGKDSQALLAALVAAYRTHRWPGPIFAVHAHLGRAEWPQTMAHCQSLCDGAGIPLHIVGRSAGADLVDRWRERMQTLAGTGKPFWSSAAQRYCTSDMKRGPIDQLLRKYSLVISAEGVRADESPNRARKPVVAIRPQITAAGLRSLPMEQALTYRSFKQRLALTWYPLHDWSESDVWQACGTDINDLRERQALHRLGHEVLALDGWPGHPAYVYGNERLSCALCVLASRNDLRNGAKHNPELFQELVAMERESGFTFRQDLALAELEVP
jgi:3'-phosphoadenosine 5'-phosphosulfate sulfotransferase (PAPS reductase)/FAD synthetase